MLKRGRDGIAGRMRGLAAAILCVVTLPILAWRVVQVWRSIRGGGGRCPFRGGIP